MKKLMLFILAAVSAAPLCANYRSENYVGAGEIKHEIINNSSMPIDIEADIRWAKNPIVTVASGRNGVLLTVKPIHRIIARYMNGDKFDVIALEGDERIMPLSIIISTDGMLDVKPAGKPMSYRKPVTTTTKTKTEYEMSRDGDDSEMEYEYESSRS